MTAGFAAWPTARLRCAGARPSASENRADGRPARAPRHSLCAAAPSPIPRVRTATGPAPHCVRPDR